MFQKIIRFSQADLKCLDDKEEINMIKNEPTLSGIFYDLDHQCKFSYGQNATVCKNYEVKNTFKNIMCYNIMLKNVLVSM